ncbi:MAG: hypothetical protein RR942_05895 [Romboutsia sp.]
MTVKKIEIQDDKGNVYHPHTSANVVFLKDGSNLEDVLKDLQGQKMRGINIANRLANKLQV